MGETEKKLTEQIPIMTEILDGGHDVKIRKRPKTGEILVIEIRESIKSIQHESRVT